MQGESIDMKDIVDRLGERVKNNDETVLILGARAGALFRSSQLYETSMELGHPSFSTFSRTRQFGACHEILTRVYGFSEIDQLLRRFLKDETFIEADILLAALIKLKVFNVVVSTSIDDNLQQALEYVGMKEGYDFTIDDHQKHTKEGYIRSDKSGYCRIMKANGRLSTSNYNIVWNTYIAKNKEIGEMLLQELRRNVVAVGLDPVWDRDFCQTILPNGGPLWYVNEDPLNRESELYETANARNVRYFVNEGGAYEDFIKSLYWQYTTAMSPGFVLHGVILHEVRQLRNEIIKLRAEINAATDRREI